jgi:hypothetical protein
VGKGHCTGRREGRGTEASREEGFLAAAWSRGAWAWRRRGEEGEQGVRATAAWGWIGVGWKERRLGFLLLVEGVISSEAEGFFCKTYSGGAGARLRATRPTRRVGSLL